MSKTTEKEKVYVGIDVSKRQLDVCLLPQKKIFQAANDVAGSQSLLKMLPKKVQ